MKEEITERILVEIHKKIHKKPGRNLGKVLSRTGGKKLKEISGGTPKEIPEESP